MTRLEPPFTLEVMRLLHEILRNNDDLVAAGIFKINRAMYILVLTCKIDSTAPSDFAQVVVGTALKNQRETEFLNADQLRAFTFFQTYTEIDAWQKKAFLGHLPLSSFADVLILPFDWEKNVEELALDPAYYSIHPNHLGQLAHETPHRFCNFN